ncbi:MAG: GNAT family N-acetyltransferase [Betaproteobacteria bacterium]
MDMSIDLGEEAADYRARVCDDPCTVDAAAWNALLAAQTNPTPFMRHEYLAALHASGSAVPGTGWTPCFLLLEREGALAAAVALYAKTHSYGEYVFDWAWAEADARHGLRYYPKLLGAVPFTPVPGTRLLARDAAARQALVRALQALLARNPRLSSAHLLFVDEADRVTLQAEGWMLRQGVQFHWTQDPGDPAPDFAALLARLQRDKRKKIQQERRRVADQGVVFQAVEGTDIDEGLWDFFHQCYTDTYAAHGSTPYLNRDFFRRMQQDMPQHWLMFVGSRGGERVAASLVAIDRARGWAWGRYWGCVESLPCVHFEACYYQPLAWCLAQGFVCFEGGAQGEHKMARGLLPVRTVSAHRLSDPRFSNAVADFLAREGQGMAQYMDELNEHQPFKRAG